MTMFDHDKGSRCDMQKICPKTAETKKSTEPFDLMGARQSVHKHVYNNCGKDIQLYACNSLSGSDQSRQRSTSFVDEDLSLYSHALIGTIPSGSSKSVSIARSLRSVVLVCDGVASIRDLPDSKDIVVELTRTGVAGTQLCPFSALHHVALPSLLMNVDMLLPPTTPRLDHKAILNRTLSTAVPSPSSSPSRQLTDSAPEEAARAACLIASCLRSWRHSPVTMVVRRAKSSATQPLYAFTAGRLGNCIVVVGGLAFSLGLLDTDWQTAQIAVDLGEEEIRTTQGEIYAKTVAAARAVLGGFCETAAEVPRLVGAEETDMSTVLAGAVLMNDYRDTCF